jgi:hypothetical protein
MIVIAFFLTAAAVSAPDPASDFSTKETRRLVWDYGRCINKTLMRRYSSLIDGRCLTMPGTPGALKARFEGDQYRYALADALVGAELRAVPPPVLDTVPPLLHRDAGAAPSQMSKTGKPLNPKQYAAALKSYQEDQGTHFLSVYGECVVRVNPAAAKALLMTTPESAEESAKFGAMTTAFATCLPEGRTVAFGKLALRGTVAINYYRLAHAAPVPSAVGAK